MAIQRDLHGWDKADSHERRKVEQAREASQEKHGGARVFQCPREIVFHICVEPVLYTIEAIHRTCSVEARDAMPSFKYSIIFNQNVF